MIYLYNVLSPTVPLVPIMPEKYKFYMIQTCNLQVTIENAWCSFNCDMLSSYGRYFTNNDVRRAYDLPNKS